MHMIVFTIVKGELEVYPKQLGLAPDASNIIRIIRYLIACHIFIHQI